MSAITAKASRKMKKYAVLTREPRCFLGSFDFSWEQRKFSDITFPAGEKNRDNLPLESYSITNEHGFVPQDEKFENGGTMREADKRMYYIVSPNSFAYNPARINVGSIGYQNIGKNVIVSSLYEVFKTSEDVDDRLLWHWFKSPDFQKLIMQLQEGGVRLYFYYDKLCMGEVSLPSLEEQRKIGKLFDTLDNLITLHQRKCANLCSPSQVVFSLLFATSTFSWEQRKLGDVGETYTGLSGKTKADFGHGQARFITYMNVFSNPISNPEMTEPIEIDPKQNEVEVGDVFFTTSSETPEEVGMSSVLLEKRGKIYLNSFCFGFRPTEKIDSYYLAYMLRSESAREKIILLAQGISRYNISKNKVMEIAVSLPSLDEQKLVGQYFRQLDNLITLHQRECISFTGRADRLILTANKKRTTSSWEQRKLGDIGKARSGVGFPDADQGGLTGVPFFKVSDMNSDGNENEMTVANNYVTAEQIADHRWSPITELPAIFFAKVGAAVMLNRKRLCRFPFLLDNNTMAYSLSPTKWDADFAKALFGTVDLTSLVQVGALPSYNAGDVESMEIYLPSLLEQEQIGAYFKHLDNLITLHQRKPFLMKWRTSDANRNQTNRLVL